MFSLQPIHSKPSSSSSVWKWNSSFIEFYTVKKPPRIFTSLCDPADVASALSEVSAGAVLGDGVGDAGGHDGVHEGALAVHDRRGDLVVLVGGVNADLVRGAHEAEVATQIVLM